MPEWFEPGMDPFHERLARVALGAAASYGFCLAGGCAVQAHGFVERVSKPATRSPGAGIDSPGDACYLAPGTWSVTSS